MTFRDRARCGLPTDTHEHKIITNYLNTIIQVFKTAYVTANYYNVLWLVNRSKYLNRDLFVAVNGEASLLNDSHHKRAWVFIAMV